MGWKQKDFHPIIFFTHYEQILKIEIIFVYKYLFKRKQFTLYIESDII